MPEEKVSRYDRDEVKRLEREIELTGDNRFVGLPAADAGPRQAEPQVSELLGKYLNTMVSDLRIERKGNYLRWLFSQYERELAIAPPVPQEAAPSNESRKDFLTRWSKTDSEKGWTNRAMNAFNAPPVPATAPDWAMRQDEPLKALRQWEADTEAPANASEGNAFIDGFNAGREAGSERERELTTALTNLIEAIDTGRGTLRRRAEASRLLGGELNVTTK